MIEKIICFLARVDKNKQNPIEYDKLLRSPGQSIDEKIEDILLDSYQKIFFLMFINLVLAFIAPWANIIFIILIFYIAARTINETQPLKLGRDGEIAVAQYLNIIARQTSKEHTNMHIFHDIVNKEKDFNIDHVVLSKKGLFIIDTKTYTKDKRVKNIIKISNNTIFKNGKNIETPILNGQAKWLQSEIRKKLGKDYDIIPIIAFVSWFVEGENKIKNIYVTSAINIKNILENSFSKIIYNDEELKKIQVVLHELASIKDKKNICFD